MKITKITVGRLYNLGNYEHVRYDLTVEVADGENAADAIVAIEKIVGGLSPLKNACIRSESEIARKRSEIAEMRTMPAVDWERRYGHCTGKPAEIIERYEADLNADIAKRAGALHRAKRARELFNDLGGAAQWKDAKLDWENYDDEEGDE